jgi:hypothetical protein
MVLKLSEDGSKAKLVLPSNSKIQGSLHYGGKSAAFGRDDVCGERRLGLWLDDSI